MKSIKLSEIVSKLEEKGLHKTAENVRKIVGQEELLDPKIFNKVGNEWVKFEKLMSLAIKKMAPSSAKKEAIGFHVRIAGLMDEYMEAIGTME